MSRFGGIRGDIPLMMVLPAIFFTHRVTFHSVANLYLLMPSTKVTGIKFHKRHIVCL